MLRFSEAEAFFRIKAARAAKRFPIIFEMLAAGSLTLTTVKLLAPYLTRDNHLKLLGAASGRSKREVEELLARRYPQPDVPTSVRKLPSQSPAPVAALPLSPGSASPTRVAARVKIPPELPAPLRRALVKPLAPERYEIRFTASAETHAKLRQAQDLFCPADGVEAGWRPVRLRVQGWTALHGARPARVPPREAQRRAHRRQHPAPLSRA